MQFEKRNNASRIDLEEEKSKNRYLECEVKCLQQEIEIINSYRTGLLKVPIPMSGK